MKRTYTFVSDEAVVIFDAPDGLEEAVADDWAMTHMEEIVQRPDEFWMDEVHEGDGD
jgi:hypothetical protein